MASLYLLESRARGQPFVVNRYGRIIFPFNFFPEIDFSIFETLEQFAAVIKRDFQEKAPAETDIVAACAGLPYGLAEAVRLLQEVDRPVLVVCGEKFSDKIGTVRTSRMIFGDGYVVAHVDPRIVAT